jgi:hypothetical protein
VTAMKVERRGVAVRGRPVFVGSVDEVGEHLRGRAMLLAGSTGLEEHRRRRSTVAGEAEEEVASDELALGPEVLGVSSSGVLRREGKVGVWLPVSDNDGVVGKGGDGESREEWHRSAAVAGRGEMASPTDRQRDR